MYLELFIIFLIISFILVGLGLAYPEHTELSLIGFVFLFLLSLLILSNSLSYKTGFNTTSNFTYTNYGNYSLLTSSFESVENNYAPIVLENNLSHIIGYWLAVISILGFIGVLMSLRSRL